MVRLKRASFLVASALVASAALAACAWSEDELQPEAPAPDGGSADAISPVLPEASTDAHREGAAADAASVPTLARDLHAPTRIGLDEAYVYWLEPASIAEGRLAWVKRVAKTGGSVEPVFRPDGGLAGFGVAEGEVYVLTTTGSGFSGRTQLTRLPKSGGAPTRLVEYTGAELVATPLRFTDEAVFFGGARRQGATTTRGLFRVPTAGGAAQPIVAFGVPTELQARGATVYGASVDWTVWSLDADGLDGRVVAHGQPEARAIVADDVAVYWSIPLANAIMAMPSAGGAPSVFFSDPETSPGALALDADHVYFADGAFLRAVPRAGGAARTLADGFVDVGELAIDECCLYATDRGAGTVRRVPK